MRRANRTDNNHKEIVGHAKSLGFFVWDVHDLKNCCDLVLVWGGTVFFVEVKSDNGKLTGGEELFAREITKNGGKYVIVREQDDINKIYINLLNDEQQ